MAKLPGMAPTLLAFDTSTEMLSVAVHGARGLQAWNGPGGAAASAALLPRIRVLLEAAGQPMGRVDAIAFGSGPGAFTGLRTACSVAQGLAFGLGVAVIAVDSLMIVAEDARVAVSPGGSGDLGRIGVVIDARMGEVYAALYRWHQTRWLVEQPAALWSPQALVEVWQADPPEALAGNGVPMLQAPWAGAAFVPTVHDRAAALMRLALMLHAQGMVVDAAQALPVYLRDKVALTTQERLDKAAA